MGSHDAPVTEHSSYHHGDVRRSAVAAAEQIVSEGGAPALSVRRVAELVGVSHGALYRHFTNRDDLLDAVSAQWLEGLVTDAADAPDVAGYIRIYVARALAAEHLYRCVFDTAARPDATQTRAALVDVRRQAAAVFAEHTAMSGDALRDGVLEMWGTIHGMVDLYWRGLIRARNPSAAASYISGVAAARW